MTGIIYGSTMGNTENAAKMIAEKLGDAELVSVTEMDGSIFEKYDRILFGCSTWGVGDLQDDWESGIDTIKNVDFSGKQIGFFGCGDQEMYPDSFVDALGTLYEAVKDTAGEIVGKCSVDGYEFSASTAVIDGEFVGLPLDEDNQSEMTSKRITAWVAGL